MGRPTKLNDDLQNRVCKALRFGVDVETACAVNGICRESFYAWRKLGREGQEPYAEFLRATEEAFLNVDLALHGSILKAASGGNWQAAAWMAKFRKTGGRQQVELTGKDGAPITGALTQESADAIRNKILFGETRPVPDKLPGEPEDEKP